MLLRILMVLSLWLATQANAASFEQDWRFSKGDFATAMMPGFDDHEWRRVRIPHDWSVEGPFGPQYASSTGYAPGGIAWYRKTFTLRPEDQGKRVVVMFDGVYDNSEVWINGTFLGLRPSGYHSFYYECTPYLHFGEPNNVIAVRVDHSRFADSRWYTGSGIYRHVHLIITDKLYIPVWGIAVTTPKVATDQARVHIETEVRNDHNSTRKVTLKSVIIEPGKSEAVASLSSTTTLDSGQTSRLVQDITIPHPRLWSVADPALYILKSQLVTDQGEVYQKTTDVGIRSLRFDADHGFFLNGESLKLKGVCLHHDAGCLGAAVPDQVLERRLRLLKDLGVNAIRTSHNPPAPELLEFCDRMGLLVMNEAFDEFTPPKNKWITGWNHGQPSHFGYGEVFKEWSDRDIKDQVRRDRNHPCVIMWSIGNEIDYANDPFSHPVLGKDYRPTQPRAELIPTYARPLVRAVKSLDTTRPVTMALANLPMSNAVGLPECLDIVGYNYQERYYKADHDTYPQRVIFGSENGDSWAAWQAVVQHDYIAGQFLWTGIDYLGEAGAWPNRANGAGLLDLCGFEKPIGWFRQSLWSDRPMVYACVTRQRRRWGRRNGFYGQAHWNWQPGQTVTVRAVTNCEAVALEPNGKLLERKSRADAVGGVWSWQVPFAPGTLKALGYHGDQVACEFDLRTAGPAQRIELVPDVTQLKANEQDICHLVFRVVDKAGVRVPTDASEIHFSIEGPARILGIGNANLNDDDPTLDLVHHAYQGRGLAIVQSGGKTGQVTIEARADGLQPARVELTVR